MGARRDQDADVTHLEKIQQFVGLVLLVHRDGDPAGTQDSEVGLDEPWAVGQEQPDAVTGLNTAMFQLEHKTGDRGGQITVGQRVALGCDDGRAGGMLLAYCDQQFLNAIHSWRLPVRS